MKVRITTITNVNIRNGPGLIHEVRERAKAGTTYTAYDTARDSNKILWYKVPYGWICSKYVTLDKDKQSADLSKSSKLKTAAGETPTWDDTPAGFVDASTAAAATGGSSSAGTNTSQSSINVGDPNGGLGGTADSALSGNSDILLGKRIFGVPYQYLPTTDIRIGGTSDRELGFNFAEMMSEVPILSVVPGVPMFMPDVPDSEKSTMVETLMSKINEIGEAPSRALEKMTDTNLEGKEMRYFSFYHDFTTFVQYFNTLCQMNAIMLGIGEEYVPGSAGQEADKFAFYDWSYYTLSINMAGRRSSVETNIFGSSADATSIKEERDGISRARNNFLDVFNSNESTKDKIASLTNAGPYYTDFVIKPNIGYTETIGNTVKDSAMAGMFNQMSDMSKEMQFLMNTSQMVSQETMAKSKQAVFDTLQKGSTMLGNSTFVNRFLKGASSVLSGHNIVFPQIWNSSNFARTYTIEIPLYTPYGSIKNIFMDILVPLWFWIAISAPHQASANSYSAPFLLKCHVPGIFNINMGMVESLTITKGVDNEWSVDGYPLAVNISVSIVDLYSTLFLSRINGVSPTDMFNFLQNSALIDYVATQSGIDMKFSEWDTKLEVAKALGKNAYNNLFTQPLRRTQEEVATAQQRMTSSGRGNLSGLVGAQASRILGNII